MSGEIPPELAPFADGETSEECDACAGTLHTEALSFTLCERHYAALLQRTSPSPLVLEERWAEGFRAAQRAIAERAIGEMLACGVPRGEVRELLASTQLEAARASLRRLCEDFGDTDFPLALAVADVIEKHLRPHLEPRSGRALEVAREALRALANEDLIYQHRGEICARPEAYEKLASFFENYVGERNKPA